MGQNKFLMIKTLLYFISNPSLTFIFLHLTKVSLELVEVHYDINAVKTRLNSMLQSL